MARQKKTEASDEVNKKVKPKVARRKKIAHQSNGEPIYAYKVCKSITKTVRGKTVVKLISGSVRGKLEKEYALGKVTEADSALFEQGFGICIFTNLSDARRWAGGRRIFKCEVGEIREPAAKRFSVSDLPYLFDGDKEKKTSFLTIARRMSIFLNDGKHTVREDSWPDGAKMANWVKLVEEVR